MCYIIPRGSRLIHSITHFAIVLTVACHLSYTRWVSTTAGPEPRAPADRTSAGHAPGCRRWRAAAPLGAWPRRPTAALGTPAATVSGESDSLVWSCLLHFPSILTLVNADKRCDVSRVNALSRVTKVSRSRKKVSHKKICTFFSYIFSVLIILTLHLT